jgi:hypothetical protein
MANLHWMVERTTRLDLARAGRSKFPHGSHSRIPVRYGRRVDYLMGILRLTLDALIEHLMREDEDHWTHGGRSVLRMGDQVLRSNVETRDGSNAGRRLANLSSSWGPVNLRTAKCVSDGLYKQIKLTAMQKAMLTPSNCSGQTRMPRNISR